MNTEIEISAFEVYTKKRKYVQLSSYLHIKNPKHDERSLENTEHEKKLKLIKPEKLHSNMAQSNSNKVMKNQNLISSQIIHNHKFISNKFECKNYIEKSKNLTKIREKTFASNKVPDFNETYFKVLSSTDESIRDPVKETENLFVWLIYPLKKNEFFKKNWEKIPLHIKRNKSKYYRSLMSTPMLDKILRYNHILFTKNLDITSFTNDVRETHNPPGRALPSVVWDYFANGCSVRLLNPQTYIPKLYALNATLQEFFGCYVGANSYLTPPNSQGFAPHYDDIEAFVLQIEGKKRWKLYKPRNENEFLPRYSSSNFSQKEIGKPILDTVVNPGDLLYFPRGTIHQGDTIGFDQHSLHITLSVYQKNSWGDFLEILLPNALRLVIENDVRFRKGLPLDYLRYIGATFSDNENKMARQQFFDQTKSLLNILLTKYVNIDKAADEMAKNHIHDYLPPLLNNDERYCSVYEGGEKMIKNGVIINRVEIEPDTSIRLSRAHCARLVEENGTYRLYYSCDNSKEYHEYEPPFLEVEKEFVTAIKKIIIQYPQYIRVKDLPVDKLDTKLQIVRDLWEKAIIVSEQPLPIIDD